MVYFWKPHEQGNIIKFPKINSIYKTCDQHEKYHCKVLHKICFAKYIAQQTNSNSLGKRVLTAKPEPAILHNRFLSLNVMLVGWLKISSHFVH